MVGAFVSFFRFLQVSLRLESARGIVLLSFTTLVAIRYRGRALLCDGGGWIEGTGPA